MLEPVIIFIINIVIITICTYLFVIRKHLYSDRALIISIIVAVSSIIASLIGGIVYLRSPSGSIIPTPSSSSTPIEAPSPGPTLIVDLNLSQIKINIDAPQLMLINHSYIVKVSLTAKTAKYISTLMLEKAQVTSTNTIPVGTPGSTIGEAFGSDYEPVADATLSPNAGPFKIVSIPPAEESLAQPQVTWKWAVIPLEIGQQILDIDIEAKWLPTPTHHGSLSIQEGRIGDQQIAINVQSPPATPTPSPKSAPFINLGQINVGEIITSLPATLFGAGGLGALFVIWLITRLKKKQRQNAQGPKKRRKRGRA